MIAEYAFGSVYVAAVPVTATLALALAVIVHRGLMALRFYRWVWHPVLFDTALFVCIWALMTAYPLPVPSSLPAGLLP